MKSINYFTMGSRIRKQRELLGYTREQFAEKIDVSTKFVSDIELGVKGFSLKTLTNISDVLHLSSDYILFGDNFETPHYIDSLIKDCPDDCIDDLTEIIARFIHSVNKRRNK